MVTLVVEFGRQRRKFELRQPIDVDALENQIKSSFRIDDVTADDYLIQIFDEHVHEYLDLACDSFDSSNNNVIKGQIIPRQVDPCRLPPKVSKQQVVGLMTLESIQNSLQQWSQLLQHIQGEIGTELQTVKETINAVKSHYQLIDDFRLDNASPPFPSVSNCSSPSTVSQPVHKTHIAPIHPCNHNNSQVIRPIPKMEPAPPVQPQRYRANDHFPNRRGTLNGTKPFTPRENNYHPSSRLVEYNPSVTVTYQRFQTGVDFDGEISKYYNPTYFFLRISNQRESYEEMHRHINSYYNSMDANKVYFPQAGDFCVAKSPNDAGWYRARIIRSVGHDKVQLIFIDTGEIGELHLSHVQRLEGQFTDRPAQALACSLAQVLPFTQSEKSGWNRRACMSLASSLKTERLAPMKVTVADMQHVKWPMMFVQICTSTSVNLTDHMCDLYLGRRASNSDISDYWSVKIRPEQFVLFNLSSLINQKQHFVFNSNRQTDLAVDQTIDLVVADLEFLTRQ